MSSGKFCNKEILISPKMPPMEYKKVQNVLRKLGATCTQKSTNDCIFILPSFTGKEYQEEFDMLRKQGRIILGVPFVYDCARTKKTLPDNLDPSTAIFSTVMAGVSVCCTGIDREERDHLTDMMSFMSGSCHRDLTNAVTHVIATSTNTEKYHAAVKFGIPVVQPKWIRDCWEQNTLLNSQEYLLYPFSNLVVSVSNLDTPTRSDIERKVRAYGGSFERDLKKNQTTHLIATEPKGKKYLGALKWGVLVVTPQWVDDCITHKVRLSEALYPVAAEDSATKSKLTSMIDSQEASKVTETEGVIHSAANSNNSFDSQSETSNSHNSAKLRASSTTTNKPEVPAEDEDSQYNTLYLSGCKIFLKGFNQETEHLLMKLVSTGSGMRMKNFERSSVTHYIVDLPSISTLQPLVETGCLNLSPSLLPQLRTTDTININTLSLLSQLKIVKSDWLEACWKAKKMVDTAKSEVHISVELLTAMIEQNNATQPKDELSPPVQPTLDAPLDTNPSDKPSAMETDNNEDANQLSPYKISSTLDNIGIGTMNWTSDENSKIREIISSNGGIFFEISTKNPEIPSYVNYILVPHGDHDSLQKLHQAAKSGQVQKLPPIVSYQWLKRSTEARTLLPLSSSIAFTPLPQPTPYPSFQKFRISISGFQEIEHRKNIATLIQLLGAEFASVLNKNCTHLICQEASGQKFDSARKWGVEKIKIVTLDWLTASAKQGDAVPEVAYLLSDTSNSLKPPSVSRANSQEDFLDEDFSVAATQIPATRTSSALNLTNHLQPVLAGVTVFISKKIAMEKQNRYEQIVSMLGGSYCYVIDKTVTHYVSETKSDLNSSEFKGRSKDIKVVSPLWLEKCLEMKAKLDEAEFPCTLNPKMSLGIVGLPLSQPTIPPPLPPTTLTSVVPKRPVREIQLVSPEPRAAKKQRTSSKKQKETSSETWDMTVKRLNMQAQKRLSGGSTASPNTLKPSLGLSPQQQVMAKHNATSLDDLPLAERITIKNQIKQATSPVKAPKAPVNTSTTTTTPKNNNMTANKEELFVASTPMTQMELQESRNPPQPKKQKSDPDIKPVESPSKSVHTPQIASMDVAVDESGKVPSLPSNPSLLSADESRTSVSDASNDSMHLDEMETEDIQEHNEQSKLVEEKVRNFFSLMASNPIVAQVQKSWTPVIAKPKAPVAPRRPMDREEEPVIASEDSENSENMDDVQIPNSQVVVYMNHAEIDGRRKLKERASGGFASELVNVQQQVQTVTKTLNNNSVSVVASQAAVQTSVQTSMPPPAPISSRRNKKPNQIVEESRGTEVPDDDEEVQEAPKNEQLLKYTFLISNAQNGSQKSELVRIVRTLGGHMADDESFGSNFTHLVTPAVTASQKCLAACAKGLILLKPDYLIESDTVGRFLNEREQEPHQWKIADATSDSLKSVIGGSYKCKQKLESLGKRGTGGMFDGMVAVLFMQQGQEQQWENILIAGGARVLNKTTTKNFAEATHVFFEPKKYKEIMNASPPPEFEMNLIAKLRNARVPILEVAYLRNFLYLGGQVQEDTWLLEKNK